MPASAAKPGASLCEDPPEPYAVSGDADSPPVRVTRSAHRCRSLNSPYGAPTLDLFADDTERATLQAMNTDIRQGMLAGFELPDVFMAAVSATAEADDPLACVRLSRPASFASSIADVDASCEADERAQDVATLDLFVEPSLSITAGPMAPATKPAIKPATKPAIKPF